MGSALTCPSSNYQGFGSKLHLCNTSPNKSCSGHEIVNSDIVENIVKDAPSTISTAISDLDCSTDKELGIAFTNVMNICGSSEYQATNVSSCDQDESSDQNEIKTTGVNTNVSSSVTNICGYTDYQSGSDSSDGLDESAVQNDIKSAGLHANISEDLCGAVTVQSLDEVHLFPSVLDAIGQSNMTTHAESVVEPTTAKLVSALKGSRAQQGLPVTKLSVKWASNVYDPPVTSESHTVKVHRRHSKSIKEYTKHKNGKRQSPRSGGGETKHASRTRSNFVDPRIARYGAAKGVKVYNSSSLLVM